MLLAVREVTVVDEVLDSFERFLHSGKHAQDRHQTNDPSQAAHEATARAPPADVEDLWKPDSHRGRVPHGTVLVKRERVQPVGGRKCP